MRNESHFDTLQIKNPLTALIAAAGLNRFHGPTEHQATLTGRTFQGKSTEPFDAGSGQRKREAQKENQKTHCQRHGGVNAGAVKLPLDDSAANKPQERCTSNGVNDAQWDNRKPYPPLGLGLLRNEFIPCHAR